MSKPAGSAVPRPPRSGTWRRAGSAAVEMRIGDAERAEAADRLAWHFSHGRLDQTEFDDRLDQAMRAKTAPELASLLADLPGDWPVPPSPDPRPGRVAEPEADQRRIKRERRDIRRPRRGRTRSALRVAVLFVVMVVGLVALTHVLTHSVLIWLAIGVIAFVVLRYHSSRTQGLPADAARVTGAATQPDSTAPAPCPESGTGARD